MDLVERLEFLSRFRRFAVEPLRVSPVPASIGDLVQSVGNLVADERARIIAWLRAHEGQEDRAAAAGACIRGSTMEGELRQQAGYYGDLADELESGADSAWAFGFSRSEWLSPPPKNTP